MIHADHAVFNNIAWCGIVCRLHGLTPISGEGIWGLCSKAPEYYPDIITFRRQVTSDEVNDFIGNREVFGIKDSFANLDMLPFGFRVLFDAKWIYHPPVVDLDDHLRGWIVVSTAEAFAQWTFASGLQKVLQPALLEEKDVKIFMYEIHGEKSGFVANLSDHVVGISNVFSNENKMIWPDIVRIVSAYFPGVPMVGYEKGEALAAALQSGWTTLGPLRVWIKANPTENE
ncbi:hypothetical protein [Paenibacillus rigui]|uniref:Uncharacterized protein n=1 Tax=Paenibacillus rigui TaxID=554312 RepID=A0A229UHL5_9BACL|nr:hypothetical protein [Paenibacillus rigui]OXM82863.1 hypothetical protein CF651_28920 [Paenibacillus rigui]